VAEKTLLLKLKIAADGIGVTGVLARGLGDAAGAERRLAGDMATANRAAREQKESLGGVTSALGRMLAAIGATAALTALAKKTFDYNQDLEGTQNSIAGLLYANQKYVDSQGRVVDATVSWTAAQAEAMQTMSRLQIESLKTAATVPQIADAFSIVYGAAQSAGAAGDLDQLVTLTTRLTQTANAFKVPMEQIRQEINSLMTGQITHDSIVAKRLGLTNEDIRQMQANHTLITGLIAKTEPYAKAADAQANSVRGKFVNTFEAIVSSLSRAFDPLIQRMKGPLDQLFNFFTKNGVGIENFVRRVILGFDRAMDAVGRFIQQHRALLTDIAAVAALAGIAAAGYLLIAGAIAVISSPITLTIAGIVALAFLWEKARKWGQIEIAGAPISAWLRRAYAEVQTILSSFGNVAVGIARVIGNTFQMIFGNLADVLLAPFRAAVHIVASLPATLANVVFPGLGGGVVEDAKKLDVILTKWQASAAATSASGGAGIVAAIRDTYNTQKELLAMGAQKSAAGFANHEQLAGPTDLLKAAWERAKAMLSGMLPELEAVGKKATDALAGVHAAGGKGGKKLTEEQQKKLSDFEEWIKELAIKASAAGTDPITEKLAAIEATRVKTRADALQKMKDSLGAITADEVKTVGKLADKIAGNETYQALNEKTLDSAKRVLALRAELTLEAQKDLDEDRLSLIDDALVRELESNRSANRQWAAEKRSSIEQFYTEQIRMATITLSALESIDATWAKKAAEQQRVVLAMLRGQQEEELNAIDADKERRDARSSKLFKDRLAEQTYGTVQWAKKTAAAIEQQFGKIDEILTGIVMDGRGALASAINGFLDDLVTGQANAMKSLSGLATSLAQTWTSALTKILVNGKDVVGQLRALWGSIGSGSNPMLGGGAGDLLNVGLQGAGIGGAVGGVFQTDRNNAGVGGAIGGGLGAAIGFYFGGMGGAKIGLMIGTAIGTAIGAMIQKGEDHIRVAISMATLASLRDGKGIIIDEKGISAAARGDLLVQIRRTLKDQMKGWQSILDLFPAEVKAALQGWSAMVNLSGGVESADITDEGALNALSDFLGKKLPTAVFAAYSGGLRIALSTMGVGANQLENLFAYWGTLQGNELQDAVRDYVVTMLEAVDWRNKFKAAVAGRTTGPVPGQGMYDMTALRAEASGGSWLTPLDDINSKMALAVASMAKLTDPDDLIAAQKQVNALAAQHYDFVLQKLREIDQAEKAIYAGNASLREQISLSMSGVKDQDKLNFFFARLTQLRADLLNATDPAEVTRLNAEMQRYVQQIFGMGEIGDENKSKLLGILNDMDSIVAGRMAVARDELALRMEKPATLLEQAAAALMQAAADLAGVKPPVVPTPDPDLPSNPEKPPRTRRIKTNGIETPAEFLDGLMAVKDEATRATLAELQLLYGELTSAARDATSLQNVVDVHRREARDQFDPAALAAALREALADMAVSGSMNDATIDATGIEGEWLLSARDFTVTFIRRNPGSIVSRTQP
jgi:hypothetical protein